MSIIPHTSLKRQVNILGINDQKLKLANVRITHSPNWTPTQCSAVELYDLGLNVFPQPIGKKSGFRWKRLQYTRLNRDHQLYGIIPLFVGECNIAIMCGRTSGNLFVIDCESDQTFRDNLDAMRQRNIPIWASKTGRGGHIYLRAKEGEVDNIEPSLMNDMEIRGKNGYILAPPSLHPSGKHYKWIIRQGKTIPTVSIKQIDWLYSKHNKRLKLRANNHQKSNAVESLKYHGLSKTTHTYLKDGHCINEGNRNNALFNAACDLAGNHYSFNETERLLTPIAKTSGLGHFEINKTVLSAFSKPRTPSKSQYTDTKNQTWFYASLFAMEYQWDSHTDRIIFLALIERARLTGNEKEIYRASIRELASLARMSTTTIQRGLKRLIDSQLIEQITSDKMSKANVWKFKSIVISKGKLLELKSNTLSLLPQWLSFSVFIFNSDMVESSALGRASFYLYFHMMQFSEPLMPSQLVYSSDLSLNQVNYALKKLKEKSIVERVSNGWVLLVDNLVNLDELADSFGVLGRGEQRRMNFLVERQIYVGRSIFQARLSHNRNFHDDVMMSVRYIREYWRNLLSEFDDLVFEGFQMGACLEIDGFSIQKAEFIA